MCRWKTWWPCWKRFRNLTGGEEVESRDAAGMTERMGFPDTLKVARSRNRRRTRARKYRKKPIRTTAGPGHTSARFTTKGDSNPQTRPNNQPATRARIRKPYSQNARRSRGSLIAPAESPNLRASVALLASPQRLSTPFLGFVSVCS